MNNFPRFKSFRYKNSKKESSRQNSEPIKTPSENSALDVVVLIGPESFVKIPKIFRRFFSINFSKSFKFYFILMEERNFSKNQQINFKVSPILKPGQILGGNLPPQISYYPASPTEPTFTSSIVCRIFKL